MTATLHEWPDTCAITSSVVTTAALPPSEGRDVAVIAGKMGLVASMPLSEGRDACNLLGTVAFLSSAQLPIVESADAPIFPPDPLAMIGPTNQPSLFELEMISEDTLNNAIGFGNIAQPYANEPEYGITSGGLRYLRCASFTGGTPGCWVPGGTCIDDDRRLISWFIRFQKFGNNGMTVAHCRYCIYIEQDVVTGMDPLALGVKWPGLRHNDEDGYDHISWRMLPREWNAASGVFPLDDYRYFAGDTGGYGTNTYMGVGLQPGRWYVIEERIQLNTPGVANGVGTLWVNGHQVYQDSAILWRDNPLTLIDQFHINIFHGGEYNPLSKIHYRIAKLAASDSYIGVPSELSPAITYPLWRQGKVKDTLYSIANTLEMTPMAAQTAVPRVPGGVIGKSVADINAFTTLTSANNTEWWAVASGGHHDGWSNKAFKIDLSAAAPQWVKTYDGTQPLMVPTGEEADFTGHDYYDLITPNDGLGFPSARHLGYGLHYIPQRERFLLFGYSCWSAGGVVGRQHVDGFALDTLTYDPHGTYPFEGDWTSNQPAECVDPLNGDIYKNVGTLFRKWTQATNGWTAPVYVLPGGFNGWQFHPMLIDNYRRHLVSISHDSTKLEWIDLNTGILSSVPLTIPLGDITSAGMTHDLDNDRYVLATGLDALGSGYGNLVAIGPTTGAMTNLGTLPNAWTGFTSSANGVLTRIQFFPSLHCVAILLNYYDNVRFLPTQ